VFSVGGNSALNGEIGISLRNAGTFVYGWAEPVMNAEK